MHSHLLYNKYKIMEQVFVQILQPKIYKNIISLSTIMYKIIHHIIKIFQYPTPTPV